ncbi:hypothetical protein D3C86_1606300 [compost metagenome]
MSSVPTKVQKRSAGASKLAGFCSMVSASLEKRWPGRRLMLRSWFLLQPPAGVWKLTTASATARASAVPYHSAGRSRGMCELLPRMAKGGGGGVAPAGSSAARAARSARCWACERAR